MSFTFGFLDLYGMLL